MFKVRFMKENMMKDERKSEAELELSEEQMQDITGGCEQCTIDGRVIGGLTTYAKKLDRQAEQAEQALPRANRLHEALLRRAEQLLYQSNAVEARKRIAALRQAIED